ncbi:MAG: RluA family pseudouridine synthase [Eubacteriaceae bacterium]|nr:RluA family pseudouridine synthase [Eubacteriaceae bacterium]
MRTLDVTSAYEGTRLDRFVMKAFRKVPKSAIEKWVRTGNVKVNGKKAKADTRLFAADIVTIENYSEEESEGSRTAALALEVLYEDDSIIALNKPAGVLSHPDGSKRPSVASALLEILKTPKDSLFQPSVINRLDYNTSGVIISAKNAAKQRELAASAGILKSYLAIAHGALNAPLETSGYATKDPKSNKATIDTQGKHMNTLFSPLGSRQGYSLIEATLSSGKTHQVRLQLSLIGNPVLGDIKYGPKNTRQAPKRHMLHCYKVQVPGQATILCIPPSDFLAALKQRGLAECLPVELTDIDI